MSMPLSHLAELVSVLLRVQDAVEDNSNSDVDVD